MEEILAILFQAFFEVGLQLLIYLPFEFAGSWFGRKSDGWFGWFIMYGIVGGVFGLLSTVVAPKLLLPHPALRIANLFAAPLIAGGFAYVIADWRRRGGAAVAPANHFGHAALFALMFGLARFAYGTH